jgi:hypothetical protein
MRSPGNMTQRPPLPWLPSQACTPPPGIDTYRSVAYSWGWDFERLPPSLAASGFVAVVRRYPLTKMMAGSAYDGACGAAGGARRNRSE